MRDNDDVNRLAEQLLVQVPHDYLHREIEELLRRLRRLIEFRVVLSREMDEAGN